MACMLALFAIEKTVGSENVKWTTGFSVCVTFRLEGVGVDTDAILPDIRSRFHAGSSREMKRWSLKS